MTLRRSPVLFWSLFTFVAGFVLIEAAWLRRAMTGRARAHARWEAKLRERDRFASIIPAVTPTVAEKICDEGDAACFVADELRKAVVWPARDEGVTVNNELGPRRAEAFFDLARFVEEMRANSDVGEVALRKDEYFGFASYANVSPDDDVIAAVVRQRDAIEVLLNHLFSARPIRLESLRRERPRPTFDPTGTVKGGKELRMGPAQEAADFFTIDPDLSLRRSGAVDTLAFRLNFVGESSALRAFLNRLATSESAWWVRSVEVKPEPPPLAPVALPHAVAGRPVPFVPVDPIVRGAASLFVVTVELVQSVVAPTGAKVLKP